MNTRAMLAVSLLIASLLACAPRADCAEELGRSGRRLLAVKDGVALASDEGADAGCMTNCMVHACAQWQRVYIGDAAQSEWGSHPAGTSCLQQCGVQQESAHCLAQSFNRILSAAPLEHSCASAACMAGLLGSACARCGGCPWRELQAAAMGGEELCTAQPEL